ncbi:MAG: hypothetical protein JWR38_3724 [Mucilaginibacter sp.]|nr:hypothetical protein [Mucilaginibacter sp.]
MTKKINIIIMFFVWATFSCKKEHSSNNMPNNKLHTVTLKINGSSFTQSIVKAGNLKVNTVNDLSLFKNYMDTLIISFADSTYGFSTKNLTSINISRKLKPDNYNIYVLGGQKGLYVKGYAAVYPQNGDGSGYYVAEHWKDSFYGKQAFTVSDTDVNLNVGLTRVNAGIEVNMTDAIPQNVTRFTLENSVSYVYLNFNTGEALVPFDHPDHPLAAFTVNVPDSLKGKTNFKINYYSIYFGSYNFTIKAFDKNGVVVASKTFNVLLKRNQKIAYSGPFFGSSTSNNAGFAVSTDPTWDPVQIIKYF